MIISMDDLENTCFYDKESLKKYKIVCKTNNRAQLLGRLCENWKRDPKCEVSIKSCKNCIYRLIEIGTISESESSNITIRCYKNRADSIFNNGFNF